MLALPRVRLNLCYLRDRTVFLIKIHAPIYYCTRIMYYIFYNLLHYAFNLFLLLFSPMQRPEYRACVFCWRSSAANFTLDNLDVPLSRCICTFIPSLLFPPISDLSYFKCRRCNSTAMTNGNVPLMAKDECQHCQPYLSNVPRRPRLCCLLLIPML